MSAKQSTIAVVDLGVSSEARGIHVDKSPFRRIGCQTLLERTIRRLSDSLHLDSIAVTGSPEFTSLVQQSHLQPSRWFPSTDESPVARVIDVVCRLEAELVMLVAPCCPFIDPVLVDRLVSAAWAAPEADYVSFVSPSRPTFSLDGLGLVAEIFHRKVLKKLNKDTRFIGDPRRIPQLVRSMPEVFQARLLPLPTSLDRDNLRFVLETEDDWERAHQLLEASGNDFDYRDLADLVENIDCGKTVRSAS